MRGGCLARPFASLPPAASTARERGHGAQGPAHSIRHAERAPTARGRSPSVTGGEGWGSDIAYPVVRDANDQDHRRARGHGGLPRASPGLPARHTGFHAAVRPEPLAGDRDPFRKGSYSAWTGGCQPYWPTSAKHPLIREVPPVRRFRWPRASTTECTADSGWRAIVRNSIVPTLDNAVDPLPISPAPADRNGDQRARPGRLRDGRRVGDQSTKGESQ